MPPDQLWLTPEPELAAEPMRPACFPQGGRVTERAGTAPVPGLGVSRRLREAHRVLTSDAYEESASHLNPVASPEAVRFAEAGSKMNATNGSVLIFSIYYDSAIHSHSAGHGTDS